MDNLQNVQLMVVGSVNGGGYSYSTFMSLTEIPQLISYTHATLFRASKPNSVLYVVKTTPKKALIKYCS